MNDEIENAIIPVQPNGAVATAGGTPPGPPELSNDRLAQLVALLTEALISDQEIVAVSGRQLDEIEQWMSDPANLAEVQRATMELRNSGGAARLEAARHAREMVTIAVGIARDGELHPSPRLAAADYVAKVAGTMRPSADKAAQTDRIRITINIPSADGISEPERVVIDAEANPSIEGDFQ